MNAASHESAQQANKQTVCAQVNTIEHQHYEQMQTSLVSSNTLPATSAAAAASNADVDKEAETQQDMRQDTTTQHKQPAYTRDIAERARREHINNLRAKLELVVCKTPDEQDVQLIKDTKRRLAIVRLRSGAKNALSPRMVSKLTDVIDELYAFEAGRCVLIEGHAGTFCSGSDLVSVRALANQSAGYELAQIMLYNMQRLRRLPMLSIAYIQGYALGGGAELAMGADLRLMTEDAHIGFVHSRVGVSCGWGGSARLVELLGRARALELLSSGRLVGGRECCALGLAEAIVHSRDEAIEFALSHCVHDAMALAALKRTVDAACGALAGLGATSSSLAGAHAYAASIDDEAALLFASTWGARAHLAALDCNIKYNNHRNNTTNNSDATKEASATTRISSTAAAAAAAIVDTHEQHQREAAAAAAAASNNNNNNNNTNSQQSYGKQPSKALDEQHRLGGAHPSQQHSSQR